MGTDYENVTIFSLLKNEGVGIRSYLKVQMSDA